MIGPKRTIGGKAAGAWRLWALVGAGASYLASVRFEFKSLTLVGASVAALYVLALGDPAEPYLGAGAPTASIPTAPIPTASIQTVSFESPEETPAAAAPESLTALIIEKSALPAEARPESVASLVDLYRDIDYRLDDIRLGEVKVPRVLVDKMPSDIAIVESPAERKQLFIKLALPLILHANERIAADRERLIVLRGKIKRAPAIPSEQVWLDGLADRYGLEAPDLDALLRRVDVIPPSLALAQGAEESGWGTSRFVREGNAIFGQRTFDKGAGLVPKRRDSNKNHEVKSFNGLMESVASYMTNLNTHDAYVEFRRIRAGQRAAGDVDSYSLVGALDRYSERGEAYIETIRSIIDKNNLRSYDRAILGKLVASDPKI